MTIVEINRKLIDRYGINVHTSKPNFRIVFSNDETEYRKGLHNPLDPYETVKEVKKYAYLEGKFVLEKLIYIGPQKEIMNVSGYSYEPVYVFQDKNGQPLPVVWWAVEFAVDNLLGKHGHRPKVTEKMDEQEWQEKKDREEKETYDYLVQTGQAKSFESGSATFLDQTKRKYFEE